MYIYITPFVTTRGPHWPAIFPPFFLSPAVRKVWIQLGWLIGFPGLSMEMNVNKKTFINIEMKQKIQGDFFCFLP